MEHIHNNILYYIYLHTILARSCCKRIISIVMFWALMCVCVRVQQFYAALRDFVTYKNYSYTVSNYTT